MKLDKSVPTWELFYLPPQLQNQMDLGYRMMKEFTSTSGKPVLYVGGAGRPYCQMLAIDSQQKTAVPIFTATALSVRAMAEYKNQFFWASEINKQPTIWYSSDPLKEYTLNPATQYDKITVPNDWFTGADGAEILDIVPFNNVMYVFFFNHDWDHAGFWCAELSKVKGNWHWELIVGDQTKGAKYPAGMGRPENGGATPFIFKDKMYVGTISTTMWRFLLTGYMDPNNIPPTGTQLFRFDKKDKWERVMPPSSVTDETWVEAINGFANPLNLYLWRFAEQSGKLYAGTFDARIALEEVGMDLSSLTLWNPKGFDLYSTTDGNFWMPEALDGFQDQFNYGARTLLTDPSSGDLYLGTANPFYGCQVWRKKAK